MKTLLPFLALGGLFVTPANFQKTEKRNVGTYDGIHIAGSYEVTLVSGSEGTLQLKGDPEDLEEIETEVKNGTLIVKQKEKSWFGNWDWNSGKVYITIPVENINKVILSGSGKIISDISLEGDNFKTILSGSGDISLNLDVTSIDLKLTGSGDFILKGSAREVLYKLTGSGTINATQIKAEYGVVKITGSGDIEMNTNKSLKVQITGSGDLVCYGNPPIQNTKVTGSGKIKIL